MSLKCQSQIFLSWEKKNILKKKCSEMFFRFISENLKTNPEFFFIFGENIYNFARCVYFRVGSWQNRFSERKKKLKESRKHNTKNYIPNVQKS